MYFCKENQSLKNTLKFACKKSPCKSSCKNLHASFLRGFCVEIHHITCNLRVCKCCNARGLYCKTKLSHKEEVINETYPINMIRHEILLSKAHFKCQSFYVLNLYLFKSTQMIHVQCLIQKLNLISQTQLIFTFWVNPN